MRPQSDAIRTTKVKLSFCSKEIKSKQILCRVGTECRQLTWFPFTLMPISVPYSVGACRETENIQDKWELVFINLARNQVLDLISTINSRNKFNCHLLYRKPNTCLLFHLQLYPVVFYPLNWNTYQNSFHKASFSARINFFIFSTLQPCVILP